VLALLWLIKVSPSVSKMSLARVPDLAGLIVDEGREIVYSMQVSVRHSPVIRDNEPTIIGGEFSSPANNFDGGER
jgi:hypothetical protein